jgi:hypothetical protein
LIFKIKITSPRIMYKAITILALSAVASAQFLNRDLEDTVVLAQARNTTVTAATASVFSAACTSSATADSCPSNYCCAKLTRGAAAVASAAAVCAPIEFDGVTFSIGGVNNTWSCNNGFNGNAFNAQYANITACNDTTVCAVGSCCATFSDFFGSATSNATNTNRRFCLDGTKSGIYVWSNYTAGNVGAGQSAQITQGSCTNVDPPAVKSFGAYIKASAMILVAVLSVAFF